VSLVARLLEANGLPTVIVGSARDIVEHCGVPRFLFNDFPLGNPCGHPDRPDMQRAIVNSALSLLASADGPRTTVVSPYAWKNDPNWRARYGRVEPAERDRLIAVGEARRLRQEVAAQLKRHDSSGAAKLRPEQ
jgi:D-proline reductase (dithiol) PrdB